MSTALSEGLAEKARRGLSRDARDFGGSVTRLLPDGRLEHTQVWALLDEVPFSQDIWREVPPMDGKYWAAAGGRVFGLVCDTPDAGCTATATAMLWGLGFTEVYVTWRYKDATPAQWKRWAAKWSKRCA